MSSMRWPEVCEEGVSMNFCYLHKVVSVCCLTWVGHNEGLHLGKDPLRGEPNMLQLPRELLKLCIQRSHTISLPQLLNCILEKWIWGCVFRNTSSFSLPLL